MTIMTIKNLFIKVIPLFDILASPFVFISAFIMYYVRRVGIRKMRICKAIFRKIGVFPIIDHYNEPLFNPVHLRKPLSMDRNLLGIDFNVHYQLELLNKFNYNEELEKITLEKKSDIEFYYHNVSFKSGDAEYLYNIIRFYKPSKIIEIGSGYSTLMAVKALEENEKEDVAYKCEHICIEPYEHKWLEKLKVKVVREIVEKIDKKLFESLNPNDILFIDSSHMIRPQGDVLYEYLEILPVLKSGVLIHIHDIFTPRDYLEEWVIESMRFWNEQYLLEAFLSFNSNFKVIGSLNFLTHHFPNELAAKCPLLKKELDVAEPGSFGWPGSK
jgi:predicted O-methyltransferase YrrM